MHRRLPCLVLACILTACAQDEPEFTLRFRDLPEETTVLDMFGSRPKTTRLYYMEAASRADRSIRLRARFVGKAPEGMSVRMRRAELLPRGSAKPILQVQLPGNVGPIRGTILIESDELPGWERRYEFAGTIEDRPLDGRYLAVRPPGMDLGEVRPGEQKEFAFSLASTGTEAVTIHGIKPRSEGHVRLARAASGMLVPGGVQRVTGVLIAPKTAGPFQTMIDVFTNAENYRERVTVALTCRVVPDYAPFPPALGPASHFPVEERKFSVTVRAREGVDAFTIGKISGHERYLTVLSTGGEEAARQQTVVFKLKRDAPTDATAEQALGVRLRLEPTAAEVVWPVRLTLNPPIFPVPSAIHFGTVAQGRQRTAEIRLATVSGRRFTVKAASTQRGLFEVEIKHAPGLSWRILVTIPKRSARGLLQDRVVIETDDPDVPRIVVEVKAEVK
ncbi:MAG: hypothetical protein ACYTG3_01450 [Planctomycetota bacterium]|jgi:hypothetical protein